MADGSSKTELQGNREQGQWRHRSGQPRSILDARVSRSGLFKIAAGLGVVWLAEKTGLVSKGIETVKDISESIKGKSTDEQNEAFAIYQDSHNQNLIEGLVIKEVKGMDGKITDVKLRDKPSSHTAQAPGDDMAGREIGSFGAGTIFSKGILVDGTDPRFGGLRNTHDRWVYVNPTGDPKDGGFINLGGFEYHPKFYEVPPIKLASFNNP